MKLIKSILKSPSDFKKILAIVITWRVALFAIAFIAGIVIKKYGDWFPYEDRILEITGLPNWIWGFGNFDGVHYLRIAQSGYGYLGSHAFFPLYILLVRFVSFFLPKVPGLDTSVYVDPSFFYSGIIVANIALIFAVYFFYKWIKLEFNEKTAMSSIVFLLLFPTSFYLGAIYTESLFILLGSAFLYYLRRKSFVISGVLALLLSATKVVGVCFAILLAIEVTRDYLREHKITLKSILSVIIAPLGLISYSYYLYVKFGDPVRFISSQPLFSQNRTNEPFILLPQVIYRYIKIFLSTPILSDKFFGAALEITFTLTTLTVLVLLYKKMRFSYWISTLGMLIIPTMTGTLGSMPRYVLTGFIMIPFVVSAMKKKIVYLYPVFIVLGIILLSLFIRGYWVA